MSVFSKAVFDIVVRRRVVVVIVRYWPAFKGLKRNESKEKKKSTSLQPIQGNYVCVGNYNCFGLLLRWLVVSLS